MKKMVLFFLLGCSVSLHAQLLNEDFNYTASSALLGQGGWTITGMSVVNPFTVGSSGLTYTGYAGSNIGNALPIANNGQDAYVSITNQTSGSLYASLLVTFSATQFGGSGATAAYFGDYFFHFTQGLITSNAFYSRLFVRSADNGNITFGVSKSSTSATIKPTYGDSTFSLNTTYLLVVKYTFNTGTTTDDDVKLYVFTSPSLPTTEPVSAYVGPVTSTQTDATGLDIVNLRQGTAAQAPTGTVDGIRVATSWAGIPLPVELISFTAIAKGRGVEIAWKTATEVNNAEFEIQRSTVNGQWTKVGIVEGNGTTNAPKSYSFMDASAKGAVSYRLKQIDNDGSFKYSNTVEANAGLTAADFELSQNFPNPFNPNTNITFAMKSPEHVNVTVYNALGQVVATLFSDLANANQIYTLNFDGKNLSSGTYFYALRSASRNEVRKMSLMK